MAAIKTNALVLRHANYRDSDRMVTLFSADRGRMDAIARGCRRVKSALVNCTEPFCAGEFLLYVNRDHYAISQCDIKDSFYELRLDYDRLVHGAYWLALLETVLMPGEGNPPLFHTALRALAHLNYSDLPPEMLTMAFEVHLMALLGFAPQLTRCVGCGAELGGEVRFDARRGGTVCPHCAQDAQPISRQARKLLMRIPQVSYDSVEKLQDFPPWREAARLIRLYVDERIGQRVRGAPPLPEEG